MSPSLYSQQAPETQSWARVELFLWDRVINQLNTIGLISAQSFAPFGCVARQAYLVFPSISIAWSSVVFFHLNLLHRSVIFKIKTKIEMKKMRVDFQTHHSVHRSQGARHLLLGSLGILGKLGGCELGGTHACG